MESPTIVVSKTPGIQFSVRSRTFVVPGSCEALWSPLSWTYARCSTDTLTRRVECEKFTGGWAWDQQLVWGGAGHWAEGEGDGSPQQIPPEAGVAFQSCPKLRACVLFPNLLLSTRHWNRGALRGCEPWVRLLPLSEGISQRATWSW